MTLLDAGLDARFRSIEDRLLRIETRLDGMPTVWTLVGLILPLYGLIVVAFIGIVYFVLSRP